MIVQIYKSGTAVPTSGCFYLMVNPEVEVCLNRGEFLPRLTGSYSDKWLLRK